MMRLSKWWHGSDPVIRAVAGISAVWLVVALGWLTWLAWPAPEPVPEPVPGVLLPLGDDGPDTTLRFWDAEDGRYRTFGWDEQRQEFNAGPAPTASPYTTATADLGTPSSVGALQVATVHMGDAHLYYDSDAGCLMFVGADGRPRRLLTQEVGQ